METKSKSAKSKATKRSQGKMRDLKPSKDAKGGGGGARQSGFKNKNL